MKINSAEIKKVDYGFKKVHKEINDTDKTIKHFISSGDSNRYNQVLKIDGFNEIEYRKNPVVMFQHGVDDFMTTTPAMDQLDFIIGSNNYLTKDGNYLLAHTKFRKSKTAEDIFEGYKNGWLNAWSKYWFPISEPYMENGFMVVDNWGIFEYSSVIIPVDSNAVTDLEANKNFLSVVKSDLVKNVLSKNIFIETTDQEINKLLDPIRTEIKNFNDQSNKLNDEIQELKKGLNEDKIKRMIDDEIKNSKNEFKKDLSNEIFINIKRYNNQLSDSLPGIVGNKVVEQLNKIGINNLENVINDKIAGAIRKVMGLVK